MTTHKALAGRISEDDFQATVIELAQFNGWLVHHARPARTKDDEWRTPVQGDAGFPDLVLVHPRYGLLVVVELKTERGKPTPAQTRWINAWAKTALEAGPNVYVAVWRPSDWPEIERVLRRRPRLEEALDGAREANQ